MGRQLLSDDWWIYRTAIRTARLWNVASCSIPFNRILAKEVVVSTMAIIYAVKEDVLGNVMGVHYTALSAYAFMFFILLYVPCLATVAVIKRETGSAKWTIFSVVYPLVVAYVLTLIIYQVGSLLGF